MAGDFGTNSAKGMRLRNRVGETAETRDEGPPCSKKPKREQSKKQVLKSEGHVSGPGQRKHAKLHSFTKETPTEIILEICSHLEPRDLLRLVRSAKVFAQYLLRPSAAWVWRASREECAPDMPPIHPDLTEQKYAFLGFGSHCQNCGTVTPVPVNWYLRKRWCSSCHDIILHSPAYSNMSSLYGHVRTYKGHVRMDKDHDVILYQAAVPRYMTSRLDYWIPACPVSELEAFRSKAEELTDEEWEVYVLERKEKKQALDAHAKLCTEWTKRRGGLSSLRHEREQAVRSRLEAMGFASVFIALVIERGFTGLRLSKRLTNKEWAGIKRHAIRAIKECEQLYIESFCVREGERIVSSYRSWYECHDPGNEFWPPPPKIWTLDAIKDSLIEILRPNFHHLQGVDDYPEPPDITIDTLAPRFENIVNNHSISSRAELLGLVPVESRLSSVQETLELARTLFISSRFEPARYPCFAFANHWRWDERGSVIISDIIILAGHDPNVMTFAQLLEENIWVECLTCAQGNVLQAPEAVGHFHRHHPHLECVEWRILEGQELETTRAPNAEKRWSCLLCGYWKTCTEDLILEHIASQHPFARPDLQYCYMSVHGELPRKPMAHATGVSTANS